MDFMRIISVNVSLMKSWDFW